jgi:hypothetical protein
MADYYGHFSFDTYRAILHLGVFFNGVVLSTVMMDGDTSGQLGLKCEERLTAITSDDKSGGCLCFLIGQSEHFIYMERRGRL